MRNPLTLWWDWAIFLQYSEILDGSKHEYSSGVCSYKKVCNKRIKDIDCHIEVLLQYSFQQIFSEKFLDNITLQYFSKKALFKVLVFHLSKAKNENRRNYNFFFKNVKVAISVFCSPSLCLPRFGYLWQSDDNYLVLLSYEILIGLLGSKSTIFGMPSSICKSKSKWSCPRHLSGHTNLF